MLHTLLTTESDPLNWTLLTNASWLSIDNSTGLLSGTPNISHIGSYWVNVSVDDGNGGMDFHNFTLTVNETNLPPVITTLNLEWALEDSFYWVDYEYTDFTGWITSTRMETVIQLHGSW
jgi:hypothetical protein